MGRSIGTPVCAHTILPSDVFISASYWEMILAKVQRKAVWCLSRRDACSWSRITRCVSTWRVWVTWPWDSSTKASKLRLKSCSMIHCWARKPARNISKSNISEVRTWTPILSYFPEHLLWISFSIYFFQSTLDTCTLTWTSLSPSITWIRIFQGTLRTTGLKICPSS